MDRLAPLFERFSLSARMFYSGRLCGTSPSLNEEAAYLHVLRKGTLTVTHSNAHPLVLDTPSILFFPRPHQHRVHGSEEEGVELVCATVKFGVGMRAWSRAVSCWGSPMNVWATRSRACTDTLKLVGRWNNWLNRRVCPAHASPPTFARSSA
jgi:hypothetical protein